MTPKQIIDRHKAYPESTEKLIESYAFTEYQKAIADLQRFGRVVEIENSDSVIIAMSKNDWKNWVELKESHWYLNGCSFLP